MLTASLLVRCLHQFKLCRVVTKRLTARKIPVIITHDGRTIRYPNPSIRVNDTVKVDLATGRVTDYITFDVNNLCMITGGRNTGRVGTLMHIERHPGSFHIGHIKDSAGHTFATRLNNVFQIGKESRPWISLPKGKGIKLSILEERSLRAQKGRA